MQHDPLAALSRIQEQMLNLPARRAELIVEARSAGHTWRQIADALGMTEHGALKASRVPGSPENR